MRRFRLNFILLILAVIVLSAGSALVFIAGFTAQAILLLLVLLTAAASLYVLVKKLVGVMAEFYTAMEMGDTSVRLRVGDDDPELCRMTESANRIMSLYRTNCMELETRKLYYDRILQVMTHEMRNAITPVIALSSDMEAHPERYSSQEMSEALGVIRQESVGIKRFLDAYYRLTHLPEPERKSISATDFISRLRQRMSDEIGSRQLPNDVIRYSAGQGLMLDIDPDLMRQAIVNILRNSLDAVAGNDNPVITLRVSSSSEGNPFITVTDNGKGVPDEVMPNLFQPFFSTKSEGSGIGLFLSRQIARLHGGDLKLISVPSKGVSVTLTLPRTETKHTLI